VKEDLHLHESKAPGQGQRRQISVVPRDMGLKMADWLRDALQYYGAVAAVVASLLVSLNPDCEGVGRRNLILHAIDAVDVLRYLIAGAGAGAVSDAGADARSIASIGGIPIRLGIPARTRRVTPGLGSRTGKLVAQDPESFSITTKKSLSRGRNLRATSVSVSSVRLTSTNRSECHSRQLPFT
jgi:hypothetical protein